MKHDFIFFSFHIVWFCEIVLVFTDVFALFYVSRYEFCSDLVIGLADILLLINYISGNKCSIKILSILISAIL